MKRLCLSLAVVAIAAISVGCRSSFIHKGQTPPFFPPDMPEESVLQAAQARMTSVHSLIAHAVDVTYRSPKETFTCDCHIFLRAPDQARVIGEKTLAGTVFDLLAQGNLVKLYVPGEKILYVHRSLSSDGKRSLAAVPWGLILGVRAEGDADLLRNIATRKVKSDIVIEGLLPDSGLLETVVLDGRTLLIKSRLLRGGDSAWVSADYMEWAQVDGAWWPLKITIRMGMTADEVKIEMTFSSDRKKLKLNQTPPPAAFTQDIPPGTKEVQTDRPQPSW